MIIPIRDYKISDAELTMFVTNLVQTMTRDLDEFAQFSIDSEDISELESLGNNFEMFPPDTFYQGDVSVAALNKDNKRAELLLATRRISNRALAKWGQSSPQYNKFGVKGMSNMTDREFLATTRLVILTSESYLSQLESEGLTQEIINEYIEMAQDFENLLQILNDMIEVRDIKTRERIEYGNEIYRLVTKYCTFGKTIWDGVNSAKYNDYLIYGTGGGGSSDNGGTNPNAPAAPTNFRYDFAERMIRWNSVSGATSYSLESSMNNVDWEEIYQGDATEYNTGEILPEHIYLRIRSHSINGYSPYANLNIVYNLVLNGPANLTHVPALPGFTWNSVANATAYEVQLRDSNATDDDYINLYFGNSTQLYHADQVGTYYVRIRAWNNEGTSPWMLLAYQVNP